MIFSSLQQIAGGGGVVYRARVRIGWDFVEDEDVFSLIQKLLLIDDGLLGSNILILFFLLRSTLFYILYPPSEFRP
jgi:hypothetical protein